MANKDSPLDSHAFLAETKNLAKQWQRMSRWQVLVTALVLIISVVFACISLFVLTRNVSRYYDLYNKIVEQHLFDYGFTNAFNRPITMDQTNCNYNLYV